MDRHSARSAQPDPRRTLRNNYRDCETPGQDRCQGRTTAPTSRHPQLIRGEMRYSRHQSCEKPKPEFPYPQEFHDKPAPDCRKTGTKIEFLTILIKYKSRKTKGKRTRLQPKDHHQHPVLQSSSLFIYARQTIPANIATQDNTRKKPASAKNLYQQTNSSRQNQ